MSELYRFGQFVLDPRRRTLSRADSPIALTPKAFDVLLFLVQHPNRLITKEELLQAVWGATFVEEANLAQYISHLRKALGDNADDRHLIVTIARKGYQFTAPVTVTEPADTAKPAAVQAPTAEHPTKDVLPGAPSFGWKASLAFVSLIILVVAGFLTWKHVRASGPSTSQRTVMLAVLPFQNLTGDPQKEYLADGLTEEMISQLGRLAPAQLGVIARTSVMGYKHKDERLEQIGRDLSVEYVLETSLRESGNHLRVTAQLIRVGDSTRLWSKDYDYQATDVLRLEDDVADAVAQEVRLRLTSQQEAMFGQSHPVNPEAFNAYLQGFYFFQRDTTSDAEMAAKYYDRATQLDPSYALAWAGLSRVRNRQVNIGVLPAPDGHRLARQAAERALALNPNLAAAHIEIGRIKRQVDFDWAAADASFQRAIALESENPEGIEMAAASAQNLGRLDQALQLRHRAAALDPLSPSVWDGIAETEFYAGQLEQAAANAKKALELSPDVWPGHMLLSQIYIMQGRLQEALRQIELIPYEPFRAYLYSIACYALGRRHDSDAALSAFISKYPGYSYQFAEVYAFRNQVDEAFQWLDRAYGQRNSGLIETKVDPFLMSLHHDPRYAALLKKLNFPN